MIVNVHVVLRYRGIDYDYYHTFGEAHPGGLYRLYGTVDPDPIRTARYMYTEGNYDCDCNRSLFIERHCDASFNDWYGIDDAMACGEEIELIALEVEGQSLV